MHVFAAIYFILLFLTLYFISFHVKYTCGMWRLIKMNSNQREANRIERLKIQHKRAMIQL